MMSYTMLCTSLWASAGMLMRFMSPSTRIIGGTPEDRCRSDALFLTANARSCAISTAITHTPYAMVWQHFRSKAIARRGEARPWEAHASINEGFRGQYVTGSAKFGAEHPRRAGAHPGSVRARRPQCRLRHIARGQQDALR